MVSDIEVHNISKVFEYYKRETGMKNSIRNFWHRERLYKEAVHDLSFSVERGEICAMLGPNGAGKTTMVKLLSGILFLAAGTARVRESVPWERKNEQFLRQAKFSGVYTKERGRRCQGSGYFVTRTEKERK